MNIQSELKQIKGPAHQAGFTLIELIMVIVILGVLSAFALPKFGDLSGNAQESVLQGALASVKSAVGISHAQWLASGQGASVTLEGQPITMTNGYPDENDIDLAAGFNCGEVATANDHDFDCIVTNQDDGNVIVMLDSALVGDRCFIYNESTAANLPPEIAEKDGAGNVHVLTDANADDVVDGCS